MIKVEKHIFLFFWLCLCCGGTISCSDKESFLPWIEPDKSDYGENAKEATGRLAQIMYDQQEQVDGRSGNERFKMVHISDTHLSGWSSDNYYADPKNLKQSVRFANEQYLRINAMVATGDLISNAKKSKALIALNSFASHYYSNNNIPSFVCTGNHDANIEEKDRSHYITSAEMYDVLLEKNPSSLLQKTPGVNYYYGDVINPQGGYIRIIALDMLDHPTAEDYDMLHYVIYSQQQIDWLINVALREGMTDSHHVIILNHFPLQPLSGVEGNYLVDGGYVHSWKLIPDIIDAYRSRTAWQNKYTDRFFSDREITVKTDFSDAKGSFICYMGGHAHCFALIDITGFNNEKEGLQKQKMILCYNQSPSEASRRFRELNRKPNSKKSNCFNIYAIDTKQRKTFITFFGEYKPIAEPDFPEVWEFEY